MGVRIVRIKLTSQIPVVIRILNFPCKIYYRGQPKSCRSCKKTGHQAKDCPFKDKCFRCGSADHLGRNYTNAWNVDPPAPAAPTCHPPVAPGRHPPGTTASSDITASHSPPPPSSAAGVASSVPTQAPLFLLARLTCLRRTPWLLASSLSQTRRFCALSCPPGGTSARRWCPLSSCHF